MTTSPDGLFQYGGQPVGALWASPWSKVYFVDGVDGADSLDGLKPTQAKKTIGAAIAVAARGDVIYVRPKAYTLGTGLDRYTETASTALAQSDLTIIGVTAGIQNTFGPKWSYVSSGYALVNIAPALHIENMAFFGEGATGCINTVGDANVSKVGGNGLCIYNCNIKGGQLIMTNGFDGAVIQNNVFTSSTAGDLLCGIVSTNTGSYPGRRLIIKGNTFWNSNGTASGGPIITIGTHGTEILIAGNYFDIVPSTGKYILGSGTLTGLVADNFFNDADVSTTGDLTLAGLLCAGNYDNSNTIVA